MRRPWPSISGSRGMRPSLAMSLTGGKRAGSRGCRAGPRPPAGPAALGQRQGERERRQRQHRDAPRARCAGSSRRRARRAPRRRCRRPRSRGRASRPTRRPRPTGRYSWPMTTVTLKVAIVAAPMNASAAIATPGPPLSITTISGVSTPSEVRRTTRRLKRSARRPPISVPIAPHASITVSAAFAVPLEVSELADEVERDERREAEEHDGARGDRERQADRTAATGRARPAVARAGSGRRGDGAGSREPRKLDHEERRDGEREDGHERRAGEAERERERRHDRRPEREPGVAADREQAHRRGALLARDVVGEPRRLGW